HGERDLLSATAGLSRPPIVHQPPALRPRAAAWLGCHGIPDRCLAVGRWRSPLCARCVGLLAGYAAAVLALFALGPPTLGRAAAGLLLLMPAAVDGGAQMVTRYRSTAPRRIATGLLAGFGQMEILGGLTAIVLRALHG
ncbi:MAG TPA: DUF2085 domain-containing protein, partial [Gemmatimonadota bacterium]|nr:DUF2085 domain-containing protein [Gemmatimonadota bacterium]